MLGEDHPAPDQLLAASATPLQSDRFIRDQAHRHHSLRRAPHARRDAALHARHHLGLHGHARPFREALHDSLLQRDPAGARHGRPAKSKASCTASTSAPSSARLGPRGLSRPLRAVPLVPQVAQPSAQTARRQHQRRRLGALLRADDARRRATVSPAPAPRMSAKRNSSAWASCRTRCCAMPASSSASRCTPAR